MTDRADRLRATLEQLHQELQETDSVDPQTRELLETTLADINHLIGAQGQPAEEPVAEQSLVDQFREAAQQFEQSHPTLAGTIVRLADILSQMGI